MGSTLAKPGFKPRLLGTIWAPYAIIPRTTLTDRCCCMVATDLPTDYCDTKVPGLELRVSTARHALPQRSDIRWDRYVTKRQV